MAEGEKQQTPGNLRAVRLLWGGLGLVALGLGAIGVILPVIPTTPFVILAAFCFARGAPRLATWLERNRLFGPILRDWRENGAIAPRYKAIAVTMMTAVFVYSLLAGAALWVLGLQAVLMGAGAGYVLSRPNAG